jgi:RHS repeat-associated protein
VIFGNPDDVPYTYDAYGNPYGSAGTDGTSFGYTGEQEDSNGLIFLRARYYEPVIGRFFQQDPSRLEENLYAYAASNPINLTDPAGLFIPELIAKSMEVSSFDTLIRALALTKPPPLLPDDDKWGFFAALLDAENLDTLRVGGVVLSTPRPYIDYRKSEMLWLKDCDEIMVGSRTLENYFDYVLLQPNYRELFVEYWRDTSPSHYQLIKSDNHKQSSVDGSNFRDLPDFHSIEVGFWETGKNFSAVADRFGNKYLVFGLGQGLGGGLFYSEGYVCAGPSKCLDENLQPFPISADEGAIRSTIEGGCGGVSIIVDGGVSYVVCANKNQSSALIYTFGLGLSTSVNISFGVNVGKDPDFGWNRYIYDRMNGVRLSDLLIR